MWLTNCSESMEYRQNLAVGKDRAILIHEEINGVGINPPQVPSINHCKQLLRSRASRC